MPTLHSLTVPLEDAGQRADAWLAAHTPLSRARIQALMADGHVELDGAALSEPSRKTRAGMRLVVAEPPPAPTADLPQDIPLAVLYEDADILVLDKPAGLVVHPAPGHADGTLVNALLHHCDDLAGIGGEHRPGIVHRLDRDTSGVMVVAKTETALAGLVAQFQAGAIHKTYQALLHGIPHPAAGRIETLIGRCPRDRKRMAVVAKGGRTAVSHYRVVEAFPAAAAALVEVCIETGRTHQIRVHLRHLGHPVLGDPVYGNARRDRALGVPSTRQLLHARRLAFRHPVTALPLSFEAPLPEDFAARLRALRGDDPVTS
jgi:23S rRNA pseudouridine1911/1915/1917 synthase